jgi:PAS domain S-box-containing protein
MSDHSSSTSRKSYQLPVTRILVILTAAAFLEELLVLFFLDRLPPMPKAAEFLLDATLLAVLIFPVLYFLVYRPMSHNIAELRRAEENLRTVSVAFESRDPILITDAQANILRANKMFLKISGYSPEELIGRNARILKTDRYGDDYYKRMWSQLLRKGSWAGETRIRGKQGDGFAIGMAITAVKNERQETTHYVAMYNI